MRGFGLSSSHALIFLVRYIFLGDLVELGFACLRGGVVHRDRLLLRSLQLRLEIPLGVRRLLGRDGRRLVRIVVVVVVVFVTGIGALPVEYAFVEGSLLDEAAFALRADRASHRVSSRGRPTAFRASCAAWIASPTSQA